MLDSTTQSPASRALAHALVAGRLSDPAQTERDASLALETAQRTRDASAEASACLLLAVCRREQALAQRAARTFELVHDWYNCSVALFVAAAMSTTRPGRLALLNRSQRQLERAKRGFAQAGDTARWSRACAAKRAISARVTDCIAGDEWIDANA